MSKDRFGVIKPIVNFSGYIFKAHSHALRDDRLDATTSSKEALPAAASSQGNGQILAELGSGVDIVDIEWLGRRRKIADCHILDHARTQQGSILPSGNLLSESGLRHPILSNRGPSTRPRRFRGNSDLV